MGKLLPHYPVCALLVWLLVLLCPGMRSGAQYVKPSPAQMRAEAAAVGSDLNSCTSIEVRPGALDRHGQGKPLAKPYILSGKDPKLTRILATIKRLLRTVQPSSTEMAPGVYSSYDLHFSLAKSGRYDTEMSVPYSVFTIGRSSQPVAKGKSRAMVRGHFIAYSKAPKWFIDEMSKLLEPPQNPPKPPVPKEKEPAKPGK